MKHLYSFMGVTSDGDSLGGYVVEKDMIDAIVLCREKGISPQIISKLKQVHADTQIGLITEKERIVRGIIL